MHKTHFEAESKPTMNKTNEQKEKERSFLTKGYWPVGFPILRDNYQI